MPCCYSGQTCSCQHFLHDTFLSFQSCQDQMGSHFSCSLYKFRALFCVLRCSIQSSCRPTNGDELRRSFRSQRVMMGEKTPAQAPVGDLEGFVGNQGKLGNPSLLPLPATFLYIWFHVKVSFFDWLSWDCLSTFCEQVLRLPHQITGEQKELVEDCRLDTAGPKGRSLRVVKSCLGKTHRL